MGYDVSFHPVPLELVEERIIPYLLGEGILDDLLQVAIQRMRGRARAKAWAQAVRRLEPLPRRFDPMWHLWGRPFFLVVDDTDEALDTYEQYLRATPEQVDALAAEQLHALAPGLTDSVRARLEVTPLAEKRLRHELIWRLDILRQAVASVRQGQSQIEVGGRLYDPSVLLRREVPFAVLAFVSALYPGWMSQSSFWPSGLLDEVPLPTRPFLDRPTALLGKLPALLPSQGWFLYPTLVENFMVGGFTSPSYTGPLRRYLAEHQGALCTAQPEARRNELLRELRKMDESLALAHRKGWGFAEATEIYSVVQGQLN
ncbi:MAG: hypothetical protein RMJ98_12150 [Myxococcales bacterium]|nr:hypothetical protein [Polyangiaceae bacterium]MDW8250039.1 hypothetical protein [Myxococcales bacterium]